MPVWPGALSRSGWWAFENTCRLYLNAGKRWIKFWNKKGYKDWYFSGYGCPDCLPGDDRYGKKLELKTGRKSCDWLDREAVRWLKKTSLKNLSGTGLIFGGLTVGAGPALRDGPFGFQATRFQTGIPFVMKLILLRWLEILPHKKNADALPL